MCVQRNRRSCLDCAYQIGVVIIRQGRREWPAMRRLHAVCRSGAAISSSWRLLYTPCTPPIHPLYTPYTPPIHPLHPLYTPYTPPTHPLYTALPHPLHHGWVPFAVCVPRSAHQGSGHPFAQAHRITPGCAPKLAYVFVD